MRRRSVLAALLPVGSLHAQAQPDQHDQMLNAIRSGSTPKVKELLAAGLDPNTRKDTRASPTFLTYAAYNGRTEIVKILLAAGAAIDAADGDMRTPLMQASSRGHWSTVDVLITNGASLSEASMRGETALSLAKQNGHHAVVRRLEQALIKTK